MTVEVADLIHDLVASDGKVMVSSRLVAQRFGKLHKNLLRAIESQLPDMPQEFSRLNFEPAVYLDEQGKERPEIFMTKAGFSLIAMGLTGREAKRWQVAYITAFERMEAELRKQASESMPYALRIAERLFLQSPGEWEERWPEYIRDALCKVYNIPRRDKFELALCSVIGKLYRNFYGLEVYAEMRSRNPRTTSGLKGGPKHHQIFNKEGSKSFEVFRERVYAIAAIHVNDREGFWRDIGQLMGDVPAMEARREAEDSRQLSWFSLPEWMSKLLNKPTEVTE